MNKKFGFTLAEVLVTLSVIGVVAAITLPTLIQNYQKQETVSKLKKSYTNLQNALQKSISENGDMSTWDFPDNSDVFFDEYIHPYYKKLIRNKISKTFYNIDGSRIAMEDKKELELPDGTSIIMGSKISNYYWIFIDINAKKGPNRLGKDIFMLDLLPKNNKLIFQSQGQTNAQLKSNYNGGEYQCAKGSNDRYAGGKCGAKIMQDGWKIKDDYPW